MTDQEQLLAEFIAGWNAGREVDIDEFVGRTDDEQAGTELAKAIALYLEIAPSPGYSADTLRELRSTPEAHAAVARYRETLAADRIRRARESSGMKVTEVAAKLLEKARIKQDATFLAKTERRLKDLENAVTPIERWSARAKRTLSRILDVDLGSAASPVMLRPSLDNQISSETVEAIDALVDVLDAVADDDGNAADPVDAFIFGKPGDE
jgi:hypothetical protein